MSRIDLEVIGTANFAQLETALGRVKAQLASINSMKMTGAIGPGVQSQLDSYLKTFRDTIDASGMYERHVVNMTNETEKFGKSLERGNLRLGQLYRTALEYRRSEMGQIRQLAREQVRMQNAVAVARGGGIADVFVPRGIDEGIEKTRILSKEYQVLRQVVSNGSTELINWGKNTQWAGRQLTVGLTVPITMFGAAAAKAFMDADKQLTRLAKVYGDATKGMASSAELSAIRQQTLALSKEIASTMGVSVTETLGVAADIAATGKEGNDLLSATTEAMRLSVLGEVDRQDAMRATLAIQTVFKQNTDELTNSINFLNAVENQTSTTINDLVAGIVKAGPVVQGLGGSIEDLALMMVAMREGGVPAAEAANAIKSSLGALINPTKQTTEVLNGFGVDLKKIVDTNAGDVIGTLSDLQTSLKGLDELSRQRAIEQIFGKFQFARMNALLNNLNTAGSQTEQVMKLAGMSVSQLAQTADRELKAVTESVSGRFQRAFETLKANLIPVGETFAEVGTMLLDVGSKILEIFNSLPDPVKNFMKLLTMGTAVIGPLIMITGVLGNFFGYLIKGISTLMLFKKAGREAFTMLGPESAVVKSATDDLTESLFNQTTAVETMKTAIEKLILKLEELQRAMKQTASTDVVNEAQVLANAEATVAAGGPYISPTSPYLKRTTGGGLKRPDITYSHLTPESYVKGLLGESAGSVMGMGTFVPGPRAAEINRLLQNFLPDVTSIRESTVTDQQRKEMLMSYGVSQNLAPDKLKDLEKIISEMSSAELAQMLPSWEKISSQQSHYVGMVKSIQQGLSKNFDQTKAALETYADDIITHGPEIAAEKLINTLKGLGVDVQKNIDSTALELEKIRQEVETLPETERPRALVEKVTTRVTQAMELPATEAIIASGAKGFTKDARKGLIETLMYAAQQTTDKMFKAGLISEELANAMQESINAQSNHQKSLSLLEDAEKKLEKTSEELANKRKEIESKVGSSNYSFEKGPKGWVYGAGSGRAAGTKVEDPELRKLLDQQTRLIDKALTASKELDAARENLTQAEIGLTQAEEKLEKETVKEATRMSSNTSDRELQKAEDKLENAIKKEAALREKRTSLLAQRDATQAQMNAALLRGGGTSSPEYKAAQERYQNIQNQLIQSDLELVDAQEELRIASEQLTVARKKNITATEKDTTETLQAAGAENQQETSAKRNASATDKDTAETLQSANAENIQEQSALNNAAANGSGGGIGSKAKGLLTKGGKLSGMGAGLGSVLSMATMIMPTGDNETLNAATNILGGAGMGASMGGMAGPWGALAGGIIGAAIPAVTAYTEAQQRTTDAAVKYGQAMSGAASAVQGFAGEMGRKTPTQKLTEALSGLNIPETMRQEAESLLQTQTGQSLVELAKGMGGAEREAALIKQLQQLTLSEIFTPEEAKAVASELAITLNDPSLGENLVNGILAVLDKDGHLIREAISGQFINTLPSLKDIAANAPQFTTEYKGGGETGKVYSESTDVLVSKASLTIGVLKSLADAESLVTLSFQKGEITRQKYLEQLDEINSRRAVATQIAKDLIATNKINVVGEANSVIADIAAANNLTDQYEKATSKIIDLQRELGQTDAFAIPLQTLAAYGDLVEGDITSILDKIRADANIKASITTIFNLSGSDEYAVDILRMINQGMDAEKIKVILETTGVANGIALLRSYNVALASIPDAVESKIIQEIDYDPQKMSDFVDKYEYINSLPVDNTKKLKTEIEGNKDLIEITENWDKFIKLPDKERKDALFYAQANIPYSYATPTQKTSPMPTPTSGSQASSTIIGSVISSLGGVQTPAEKSQTAEIEKQFDKKIKQQDQIINAIQKEREERQKLLELEKAATEFALREQDLRNQILRAKAEGRLADAAMLQSQLDAERTQNARTEAERKKQEREDKRIAAAERKKKQLEKEKTKALEAAQASDQTGISQQTADAMTKAIVALEAFTNTKKFLDAAEKKGPYSTFFDSKQLKAFREEMIKLNIPAAQVDEIINGIYDSFVSMNEEYAKDDLWAKVEEGLYNSGIAGDVLKNMLPDIYGIMRDESMNSAEKIKLIEDAYINAGNGIDEAKIKAQEFYAQASGVNQNVIDQINNLAEAYAKAGNKAYGLAMKQAMLNYVAINPNASAKNIDAFMSAWAQDTAKFGGSASGGLILGAGTKTSDSIPTMLSNGEYVIRASSVDKYGLNFLDSINQGTFKFMANGGYSRYPSMVARMANGGYMGHTYASGGLVSESSIEYNINVNVEGSNSSADEIANKVMQAMQRREMMKGRSTRL